MPSSGIYRYFATRDRTMSEAAVSHRRGQFVLDTILDATLGLIAERSDAFSIDEVADAAGVHKSTIYRKWATKAALVGAAVERLESIEVPIPDSGAPLQDLTTLALLVAKSLRAPAGAQAIRGVVAAASEDPGIVDVAQHFLGSRYQAAVELVTKAVAAGKLRSDIDPLLVWQAMVNPLHLRAILGEPADDSTARTLVDLVLDGARTSDASATRECGSDVRRPIVAGHSGKQTKDGPSQGAGKSSAGSNRLKRAEQGFSVPLDTYGRGGTATTGTGRRCLREFDTL
jgi:AcrR family transcriptional regulator